MSHSCPNLVCTSFLYNPYIPFLISANFVFIIIIIITLWLGSRSRFVDCRIFELFVRVLAKKREKTSNYG